LFFLLLSNALNSRRDKSILYSRITILILISSIILSKIALYASFLDKGIGLYGGIALSLAITLFSFVGVPPLMGFFAKQMVLSSALDSGYVFMALIAILTSVISAVYYLAVIKQIFFDNVEYDANPVLNEISLKANLVSENTVRVIKKLDIKIENIVLSTSLTTTISFFTFIILLSIFIHDEWLSLANILSLIIFNP